MKCFYCGKEASGICKYCGKAVCIDCGDFTKETICKNSDYCKQQKNYADTVQNYNTKIIPAFSDVTQLSIKEIKDSIIACIICLIAFGILTVFLYQAKNVVFYVICLFVCIGFYFRLRKQQALYKIVKKNQLDNENTKGN